MINYRINKLLRIIELNRLSINYNAYTDLWKVEAFLSFDGADKKWIQLGISSCSLELALLSAIKSARSAQLVRQAKDDT